MDGVELAITPSVTGVSDGVDGGSLACAAQDG
jgi:hypothetical protein